MTAPAAKVVVNQLYGGGGNSGSVFSNDFIELFNDADTAVSLAGWSVQYNSAAGTGAWQVTPLTGTIPPANGPTTSAGVWIRYQRPKAHGKAFFGFFEHALKGCIVLRFLETARPYNGTIEDVRNLANGGEPQASWRGAQRRPDRSAFLRKLDR